MKFTDEELIFLKNELEQTPIMSEDELKYIKSAHPQLYYTTQNKIDDNVALHTDSSWIYTLKNKKLNKFISNKFNESEDKLYMIHRLIYTKDGYAKRHRDRITTYKTVSIILSDKFEGGDMYINDKIVSMNNAGEYICFNGGNEFHEVKKITNGIREVLIVWFSHKKPKFSII